MQQSDGAQERELHGEAGQGLAVIGQIVKYLWQYQQVRVYWLIMGVVLGGNLLVFFFQNAPGLFFLLLLLGGVMFFAWPQRGAISASALMVASEEECLPESVTKRKGLLAQIQTLDDIRLLTPSQFERMVAELMEQSGYMQVLVVGGRGDFCVDIKAVGPDGKQIAVQCKRYDAKKKIRSEDMQTFIGMLYMQHRVDRGIYVTTSSYTKDARTLGENNGIELIDGEGLVKMISAIS